MDLAAFARLLAVGWTLIRADALIPREVDPLLASLFEIRDLTPESKVPGATTHNERLDALVDFFSTVEKLGARFVSPPGRGLQLAASLLGSFAGGPSPRKASPEAKP